MDTNIASAADFDRVTSALTLALCTDPVMRWLVPTTDRFAAAFADMVRLSASAAFDAGTVDIVYDGAGAALWVPPNVQADDEAYAAFFQRHVDATRLDDVFTWGQTVGACHPKGPHWYLAAIGIDPYWQGQGFGSQLMRRGLERSDRDGLPTYLETALERNVDWFSTHGFAVTDEIRVADAPPLWPMLRPAGG